MAENTVVVTLKVDDQMSGQVATATGKVDNSLKQSKTAFSDLGNEIKNNFTGALKGAVIGFLGFQAINKTIGFLKDARMEFKEQVQMQSQLRAALGYTSQALNEQAAALGRKLVVDNEEITAVQIKLANYVKNEEQIKRLTPAVLDLAAATGMDMASAANMVARGIADDNGELGRFKIAIDGAKGSAERIDSVIRGINGTMKDQSLAVAESKDWWDKLGVSIGNAKESIWGYLTETPSKADYLTKHLADVQKQLENAKKLSQDKSGSLYAMWFGDEKRINYLNNELERTKNSLKEISDSNKPKAFVGPMPEGKEDREKREKEEKEALKKSNDFYVKNKNDEIEIEQMMQEAHNNRMEAERKIDQEYYKNKKDTLDKIVEYDLKKMGEESDFSLKRYAEQQKMAAMEKQLAMQAVSTQLGMMASIFAGQQKYKAAYKVLAIGQAMIDTYTGAQAAYKSAVSTPIVGPVLGPIAAATAIGIGLSNVAQISKYASGTAYAGGQALVGENGPEIVNLPRGASVYNNTQTRNMTTNAALNVTIHDSSGNITETVRAQLRSGQGDQLIRDIQNKMARMI